MSADGSQKKYELLISIATSRLEIINGAEELVQLGQNQATRLEHLKNRVVTVPVVASLVATLGSVLLLRFFSRRKNVPSPTAAPTAMQSPSLWRFIVELTIMIALPILRQKGLDLAGKKLLSFFKF